MEVDGESGYHGYRGADWQSALPQSVS
jgi:hypothetical protein